MAKQTKDEEQSTSEVRERDTTPGPPPSRQLKQESAVAEQENDGLGPLRAAIHPVALDEQGKVSRRVLAYANSGVVVKFDAPRRRLFVDANTWFSRFNNTCRDRVLADYNEYAKGFEVADGVDPDVPLVVSSCRVPA